MRNILAFILLIPFSCFSQIIKTKDLEGIWKYNNSEVDYTIFRDESLIWFGFFDPKNVSMSIDKIGFVHRNNPELLRNFRKELRYFDSSEVRLVNYPLPDSLIHLVHPEQKDENDYFYWAGTLCYLALDEVPATVGTSFELINANVFGFTKVNNFPNAYLTALYNQSIKDKRNYCQEFLGKEIKLTKAKNIIYSLPNQPTKMYLIKGDPVEIVTKKDSWLQIRYYPEKDGIWTGSTIEGWVKLSDVE